MLEELKGNRREQSGLSEKERMKLEWPKITDAVAKVWQIKWEGLSSERGNDALRLAFYLGQRCAGLRLRELSDLRGGIEYPAVSIAITRIGNRLKIDRELQKKLKQVAKLLKVEI
jgi:chromosomal replication initiation ATPase DnaA